MKFNLVKTNNGAMYVDKDELQCATGSSLILANIKGSDNPRITLSELVTSLLNLNDNEKIIYNCIVDALLSQRRNGIAYPHISKQVVIKNAINTKEKTDKTYYRAISDMIEKFIIFPFPNGDIYINPIYDVSIYYKSINHLTHIVLHLN